MTDSSKHTSCIYCGDAPTNHQFHFFSATLEILSSVLFPPRTTTSYSFLSIEHSPVVRFLCRIGIELLGYIKIVSFSDEGSSELTTRSRSIWNEAKKRGIRIQSVQIFGKNADELRALLPPKQGSTKRVWEYFQSIPIPPWIFEPSPWIDDKNLFKKRFEEAGLPVPRGASVATETKAVATLKQYGSVIVKPRTGSRARHTTVHITTEEEVRIAFKRAQQLCAFVLVEEYISGSLYRATCVTGKCIGVIKFIKPSTVADGIHTVEELRVLHNAHKKFPTLTDVKADAWFFDAIHHQGVRTLNVPTKGTSILLSEHSERPNGGYFIDVTDSIPQSTLETIEQAARVSQATVVGFDILSENLIDTSKTFTFIEGNSLPYIELHDVPFEGAPRNVAAAVWDLWESDKKSK